MGCGCLALIVGLLAAVAFLIYASTDPGPPVEGAVAALVAAGILLLYRALGVPRVRRG